MNVHLSASEVVRDALRLLADRDELMDLRKGGLRKKIAQGLDSLGRGEGVDGDDFFAELQRKEAAAKSKPRSKHEAVQAFTGSSWRHPRHLVLHCRRQRQSHSQGSPRPL